MYRNRANGVMRREIPEEKKKLKKSAASGANGKREANRVRELAALASKSVTRQMLGDFAPFPCVFADVTHAVAVLKWIEARRSSAIDFRVTLECAPRRPTVGRTTVFT